MNEDDVITGGLTAVSAQPVMQPPAQQPLAPPQQPIDPLTKARIEYDAKRRELIERQRMLLESLEARISGPQDIFMAMAQGFGAPTRSGSFGESLSNALGGVSAVQKERRGMENDLAKMRMELGVHEAGMAKEDLEFAKTQHLSGALTNLLSGKSLPESAAAAGITKEQASMVAGMPAEYKGMIIAQLQTGDVKGAIQELQKYMLEQTKEPEKIKELKYYISQLQSPAAKSIAQQLAANNYFLGSPSDRAKTILDIQKAMDQEIMPRRDGNILIQGLTNIGGGQTSVPSTSADNVYRTTKPTEQEAAAAAINANAARIPFSISVQPSASVAAAPAATGEPLTQRQRELDTKKQEEAIARAGREAEETSKNVFTDFINTQNSAQGAFSRINSMDIYKNLGANAAAGGVQPVITGVKNILSSFGFTPESLVNEQVMSATIDNILTNYMKELGARGLTNTDMLTIKNSLPTLNTSKEARVAVANIIQKANQKIIDQYRVDRVNLSENYPSRVSKLPFPNFYVEWIAQTKDAKDFVNRYKNAKTQEEKEKEKKQFDAYYGFGAANKFVGE